MDSSKIPPRTGQDDDRRREALRELAAHMAPDAPTGDRISQSGIGVGTPVRPPRGASILVRNRRVIMAIVAILIIIALVGGVLLHQRITRLSNAHPQPVSSQLTISLSSMGFACPSDASWSPNSQELAMVVAYDTSGCDTAQHGVLILGVDGRKVAFLPLNSAFDANAMVVWTPDGHAVATLGYSPDAASGGLIPTLSIFPLDGARQTATMHGAPRLFSPDTPVGFTIWNVKNSSIAHTSIEDIPPAQSYRWTDDGALAPAQRPTSVAGAAGSGAVPFWQSGYIVPLTTSPETPPQAESYQALVSAWSPDGRFVVIAAPFRALLPFSKTQRQPAPNSAICQNMNTRALCAHSPLTVPDKAFALIQAQVDAGAHLATNESLVQWDATPVAWRPDGRILATVLPNDGFAAQGKSLRVTLYDANTGAMLWRLTAHRSTIGYGWPGALSPMLAWAPSGKRLCLLDYDSASVTLWSGSALP